MPERFPTLTRLLLILVPACLVLAGMAVILPAGARAAPPIPVPGEVTGLADTVRARLAKALEASPEAAGVMIGLDALIAPPAGGRAVARPLGTLKGGRAAAARPASGGDATEAARKAALAALAAEFVKRMGRVYGPGAMPGSDAPAAGPRVTPGS